MFSFLLPLRHRPILIMEPDGRLTSHCTHRRPCWHRAAWRLLRKAAEMVQPVRVMPTEAELQALVDELFA
jgi:hypothetical protein